MSLKVLALSCILFCFSSGSEVIEPCDLQPVHHLPSVVEKKVFILDPHQHHHDLPCHTHRLEHFGRAFPETFLLKDSHHNPHHYHHHGGVHCSDECVEIPLKKVIDVNVAVKKEPTHKIVHSHHHKFHPAEYIVKSPSLALKEREAIYVGGQHERKHAILPGHCNVIVKEVDPCNSCFNP